MSDGLVVVIGSDSTGRLIEVGVVEWHGTLAVAHAVSPARDRFLR